MIRFLVQFRSALDDRPAEMRLRRLSADQLRRIEEATRKIVTDCSEKIKKLLPPAATVQSLETLGGAIVAVPLSDDVPLLQKRIKNACGDLCVGFANDAEVELLAGHDLSRG